MMLATEHRESSPQHCVEIILHMLFDQPTSEPYKIQWSRLPYNRPAYWFGAMTSATVSFKDSVYIRKKAVAIGYRKSVGALW